MGIGMGMGMYGGGLFARFPHFHHRPDITAPNTPIGLSAVPGDTVAQLSWTLNMDTDTVGYNVYVNGFKNNADLITTLPYVVTGLTNGTSYTFMVTAVDAAGNESAQTAAASATPAPVALDGIESYTYTTYFNAANQRVYGNVFTANESISISGVKIYSTNVATTTARIYTGAGVLLAESPAFTTVAGGVTSVDFTTPVQINALDTFVVCYVSQFTGTAILTTRTINTALTLVRGAWQSTNTAFPDLDPGNSGYYVSPIFTLYTDTTAPAVPTGLSALAGDTTVQLDWTANAEPDLAGYNVYVDGTKNNVGLITTKPYTVTGLTNDTAYNFTITAVDNAGNESVQTAAVVGTPVAPAPRLTETYLADYNVNMGTMAAFIKNDASWVGTPIIMDATVDRKIQGFALWLKNYNAGATATVQIGIAADNAGVPGTILYLSSAFTTTDTVTKYPIVLPTPLNVLPSNKYWLIVDMRNSPDNNGVVVGLSAVAQPDIYYYNSSGWHVNANDFALEVTYSIPDAAPSIPTGLTVTAGDTVADLTWTANSETDLAGYNIYVDGTKNNVGLATGTSYQVTGLTNDTQYSITMTAVDTNGNESVQTTASLVTPAVQPVTRYGLSQVTYGANSVGPYAVGEKFTALHDIVIQAIGLLPKNSGTISPAVYDAAGTLLGSAPATAVVGAARVDVPLSAPVTIPAGTTFIVGYNGSVVGYTAMTSFGVERNLTHVGATYNSTATGAPTVADSTPNYVTPVFTAAAQPETTSLFATTYSGSDFGGVKKSSSNVIVSKYTTDKTVGRYLRRVSMWLKNSVAGQIGDVQLIVLGTTGGLPDLAKVLYLGDHIAVDDVATKKTITLPTDLALDPNGTYWIGFDGRNSANDYVTAIGMTAAANTIYWYNGTWNANGNTLAMEVTTVLPSEIPDVIAPNTPTGLAGIAGDTVANLTWNVNTETDLAGYNVYVDGIKNNVGLVTGTAYQVTGLTNDTQYSITVTAVDRTGNESAHTTATLVTPVANLYFFSGAITHTGDHFQNYAIGYKLLANATIQVVGIRISVPGTGVGAVSLYDNMSYGVLATKTHDFHIGINDILFDTPVTINYGAAFTIGYDTTNPGYQSVGNVTMHPAISLQQAMYNTVTTAAPNTNDGSPATLTYHVEPIFRLV